MEPPLTGRWHHGNGVLVCGTLRIATADFDTNPSPQFQKEMLDWMCEALNQATKDASAANIRSAWLGMSDAERAEARCQQGDHIVGDIAGKQIHFSEWEQAVTGFEAVIEDFNTRGRREQIPHPGWCITCKFCPHCGASLAGLELRKLDWKG